MWRNLCALICLRHLFRSRAVTNQIFLPKKNVFLHACATCSGLPSNLGDIILDGNSEIGAYVRSNLCYLLPSTLSTMTMHRHTIFRFSKRLQTEWIYIAQCSNQEEFKLQRGQTGSTPVDKYDFFIELQKAFDAFLNFNFRGPL